MGISKSQYSKLEAAEKRGECTVNQMRRIAEAMDCEVVYIVRPRQGRLFSERIWQLLLEEALRRFQFRTCTPHNKSGALAAIAEELIHEPGFRRSRNWSRNE